MHIVISNVCLRPWFFPRPSTQDGGKVLLYTLDVVRGIILKLLISCLSMIKAVDFHLDDPGLIPCPKLSRDSDMAGS